MCIITFQTTPTAFYARKHQSDIFVYFPNRNIALFKLVTHEIISNDRFLSRLAFPIMCSPCCLSSQILVSNEKETSRLLLVYGEI